MYTVLYKQTVMTSMLVGMVGGVELILVKNLNGANLFFRLEKRLSGFHLEIFVWGGTGEVDSIVSL